MNDKNWQEHMTTTRNYRSGLHITVTPPQKIDNTFGPAHCKKTIRASPTIQISSHADMTIIPTALLQQLPKESLKELEQANIITSLHLDKEKTGCATLDYTGTSTPISELLVITAATKSALRLTITRTIDTPTYIEHCFVIAEQDAQVHLTIIDEHSAHTSIIAHRHSYHKDRAHVSWTQATTGSVYAKINMHSELAGTHSSTVQTIGYLAQRNKYDLATSVRHQGSDSRSLLRTRGICQEHAQALSKGHIAIDDTAKGACGQEHHDALITSNTAEADAIPTLDVRHHEVRCTHSSSISTLHREDIYYLMSRGLSEKKARQALEKGFLQPLFTTAAPAFIKALGGTL
ncbi:hypothetical protein GF342_01920 [Candidatus Woesearchaeota archaeon]|nr:hypothetical protein [Candidatus Woesearchaeota archaeon]